MGKVENCSQTDVQGKDIKYHHRKAVRIIETKKEQNSSYSEKIQFSLNN
ncbi:hypothetical protein SDC9_126180 [bioreactor metagenome]|uniref:Uncharacterized protein n=1 Tax=bioreactor metagenome TaxID=1076179 RepID=A0A645CQG1_9ZZZZ